MLDTDLEKLYNRLQNVHHTEEKSFMNNNKQRFTHTAVPVKFKCVSGSSAVCEGSSVNTSQPSPQLEVRTPKRMYGATNHLLGDTTMTARKSEEFPDLKEITEMPPRQVKRKLFLA